MPVFHLPRSAFLWAGGGSINGTGADVALEKVLRFFTSPFFRGLCIVIGVLFLLWLLMKIYTSIGSARLDRLIYERHFSEEGVYEGEEVELVEIIRNPGIFPMLGVEVESYIFNELEIEGYVPDERDSMQYFISRFNLWPYMQITRHHRIKATKRGYYKLRIATVYSGKGPLALHAPTDLYVYPKAIPPGLPGIAVGRVQGDFISQRHLYTDPFSLSGIRDYRFGDSVSQINFKASARVPMTGFSASPLKVNARDFCASRRLMIYMNFHLPMGSRIEGREYDRRAERGLSFAAALVRDAIYEGFAVGFAANCKAVDGELSSRFSCESTHAQMLAIMKEMARMNPADGASFASILDADIRAGMRDTEIVILCFDMEEDVLDRINTLERMGNSVQTAILEGEEDENHG